MNFSFDMSIRNEREGMICNASTGQGHFTVCREYAREIRRRWNMFPILLAAFKLYTDCYGHGEHKEKIDKLIAECEKE